MLEAARQALENIDKGQLTELKSFASPPETVKFVLNMVGQYRAIVARPNLIGSSSRSVQMGRRGTHHSRESTNVDRSEKYHRSRREIRSTFEKFPSGESRLEKIEFPSLA